MSDEARAPDSTRVLLRTFGVTVTGFEDRSASILAQARALGAEDQGELPGLAQDLLKLTSDLNARLQDVSAHVIELENRAMAELKSILEQTGG
jgi:hypothetical protein